MATIATSLIDRLAEESGAKVEIDTEGTLVVTPATDPRVFGAGELYFQLRQQLSSTQFRVVVEGPRWAPFGGDKPWYVPDVAVVQAASIQRSLGDFTLDPPPMLVVEVLSPESRRRDLGEKADAYLRGGANGYWTVELPKLCDVDRPTLTVRRPVADGWAVVGSFTGAVDVDVDVPFVAHLDLDLV